MSCFKIEDIPCKAFRWEVEDAFAEVLHGPNFYNPDIPKARPVNFQIDLEESRNGLPSDGRGKLTIPDTAIAEQFRLWLYRRGNGVWVMKRELDIRAVNDVPPPGLIHALSKLPYVSSKFEWERELREARIRQLRVIVDAIQFGVFFRPPHAVNVPNMAFSNEHEIKRENTYTGELLLDYDHKLFRIEMGDYMTEDLKESIIVDLSNIKKCTRGRTKEGDYYFCVELWNAPRYERENRLRSYSGDYHQDRKDSLQQRLPHLGGHHQEIAQFAYQLRLVVYDRESRDNVLKLCEEAGIRPPPKEEIPMINCAFFHPETMKRTRAWIGKFPWPVRFQLSTLLLNCIAHPGDFYSLRHKIEELVNNEPELAGDFLRRFTAKLRLEGSKKPLFEQFDHALQSEATDAVKLKVDPSEKNLFRGSVQCPHVIITPTRIILDGPYDTQSNRIIRKYWDYKDNFIRVEFREETKTANFKWPPNSESRELMQERFLGFLRNGLEVAGRLFKFLGYSNSGLREQTAWFMSDFEHSEEGLVDANKIRDDLGDFSGCIDIPSKYAARIAQAFSGTDPSIPIQSHQWEENEDLGKKPYEHTDGQGTISIALRDEIWDALVEDRPERRRYTLKPSAFQFRFLGFKGVVVVDERLQGSTMRLRTSMHKYKAKDTSGEIEIAKAYVRPGPARLCRPLIAVLEDRGVRKSRFLTLQEDAKKKVVGGGDKMDAAAALFQKHDLGGVYGLRWILRNLKKVGIDMSEDTDAQFKMDNDFISRLIECGQTHILREIKHDARIEIEQGYQLVGVVDEGRQWEKEGVQGVHCLKEGQIFANRSPTACVQKPDDNSEPEWIEGDVTISRSPHIHPGDVQRVWAIGKPPDDVPCFFRNLRNVVVMPATGDRSMASCLAGGDVDGDEFLVIKDEGLLPLEHAEPAAYEGVQPNRLGRDSTFDDVCKFFVEYMQSDLVGILADRHLVIADQSRHGTFDRKCLTLAGLCSQAVDYPKNGTPVNFEDVPGALIRAKPDWKKKEDGDPNASEYYTSTKALGELFRNIEVKPIEVPPSSYPNEAPLVPGDGSPLADNISAALRPSIEASLGRFHNTDSDLAALDALFRWYSRELGYICLTHAPAETSDVRLSEEEVVIGAILAHCAERRWKKDRKYRMREHTGKLVEDVKYRSHGLGAPRKKGKEGKVTEDELLAALAKGWAAWDFGMRHRSTFGAKSFSLIGLNLVCEMLGQLGKLIPVAGAEAEAGCTDSK